MNTPAENYELFAVPMFFAPWASCLIEAARPQPGERVLDVGCGTGIVARRVAPLVGPGGAVTGLDLSPAMLAVAREAAGQEGLVIDWREGRAEELPFPDGGFDLAVSQFALMFFADPRAGLAEMHRVLAAGGRVAVSVFQGIERHPFYQVLDEAIGRRLGMPTVRAIFSLGDAGTLRTLLTDAGFRNVAIEPVSMTARFPEPEAFLAGEIEIDAASIPALQHLDAPARQELVAALREDMAGPLGKVTEDDHVVLPFHVYVARADR